MNNPTYYETIVKSDIWKAWAKHAEENLLFDMPESIECGWLSDEHWNAFIKWVVQAERGRIWIELTRNKFELKEELTISVERLKQIIYETN